MLDDLEPEHKPWALFVYLCGDNKELAPHTQAQVDAIRSRGGFDRLHVAVQWDLPGGARRLVVPRAGETCIEEDLGRRNTGDPDELTTFLGWAIERCPATHAALVLSGTGLLDPRASIGQPDVDRSRIFTVLDDTTERDAFELASLRSALAKALSASSRSVIDVLAFDINELQFLEVAYELDQLVEVLVAPQTQVPAEGWNFELVLDDLSRALAENANLSARDLGRILVDAAGRSYQRVSSPTVSVSALDLARLSDVANAFDALSLAMLYSVGEDLVWQARDRVFCGLRHESTPSPQESVRQSRSVEDDWLYDLFEMLSRFEAELRESARHGLAAQLTTLLRAQDAVQLLASLRSIDRAAFTSGSRLRFAGLKNTIADPAACRRALRQIIRGVEVLLASDDHGSRASIDAALDQLIRTIGVPEGRGTWLEDWPAAAIDALESPLRAEYRVARREQQRARQIGQLCGRVLKLLVREDGAAGGPGPLVFARSTARGADAGERVLAGVSLFRPSNLDHLIASDYLKLDFNKRIHWTALLAVINLIGRHPRALWRIVSGVLATADYATRSELLSRIIGPDSVIGAFRQQFTVLAPLSAMVLSLEPQSLAAAYEGTPTTARSGVDAYRVRLERAGREALIEEATSVVDARTVKEVMDRLETLMKKSGAVSGADAAAVESLGRSLGEDILQGLGLKLEKEGLRTGGGAVHLQLQIPRSLMAYPWELMHHRGGWISQDFALGRQVFTSGRAAPTRARLGGPIRALVIGNPKTSAADLPYGQQEAENLAEIFERLRDETDGLLDFDRSRDSCIGGELSGLALRKLLRERRYDIIHFAGHARFDVARPELSAWQLSDGPLTAQTIGTTLDWSDTEPWLVFANACEAGMDGERRRYQGDVFGLASAFLNQGVSAYIAPLWPIHDAVAAEMAQVFYTSLLKERHTAGESLRLARVAAKRKYYDPALESGRDASLAVNDAYLALLSWAGVVLYGNSTTTIGQRLGAPTLTDR